MAIPTQATANRNSIFAHKNPQASLFYDSSFFSSPLCKATRHDQGSNIKERLLTPRDLKQKVPLSHAGERTVNEGRETIQRILCGDDPRLLVVVGPCSIHDVLAARDYAQRLQRLADELKDTLYLVMRVYFEKPRTTTGWKGLINDPRLNGSYEINDGLYLARTLLVKLSDMGLPLATESLDPMTPGYLQDCISWSAIGARTTESQTHREMASGLPCPVGFKNGTGGNLSIAINAMKSAIEPHCYLGIDETGHVAVHETEGNSHGHIVLRGSHKKPNFDRESVEIVEKALIQEGLAPRIMIDCSHDNSRKKPMQQPSILENVTQQIIEGNRSIFGVMIESFIGSGNQSIPEDIRMLKYGVSITDGCIDWDTTAQTLRQMAEMLYPVLNKGNREPRFTE